ncbi:MAG: hypothetical protein R6V85_12730 [Polyangia bacterium]
MLKKCAPGYTKKERKHNWLIRYDGKSFPNLPKGAHKRRKAEIEIGHVRQLVRLFEIEDCAAAEIPALR